MYGYKKIRKTAKRVLSDAVNTLVPVNPSRSTLKDNSISPVTSTSLEDTIADLKELNWQECCVTSIESLYSSNKELIISDEIPSDPTSFPHYSDSVRAPDAPVIIDRHAKKQTPKRKKKKLSATCRGTGGGSENAFALDCVSLGSC
ncbi:hypothetical protein FEM48_Zijuj04G0103400 [Ziziphus jujuba var. spinosa]|uniref:Uncharacterized protein n=1 Tax=Ziziphus jujuba var. spinosa TaxID=714518 RepID=A0A978VJB6_ZIZJJ|nr:hypothetical protein FEM48_Zijuj04G0103400 [Ziziphus jujuba var. spinosa]